MNCYDNLARWYDQLTQDVPYADFADFYEAEFQRCGGEFRLLLDLCCGTGTLTYEMAQRGYDMIAADSSTDMLMQAQSKARTLDTSPLFLLQRADELDLYGTVDAAYSSLDSINYIPAKYLSEVFRRLRLFIRPGGVFIFDIRTPEWLRAMNGNVLVDENDDVLCLWRADYDETLNALVYGMDIFSRTGSLWSRSGEEHIEYVHEPEMLKTLLEKAGFSDVRFRVDCPQGNSGRIFITAIRA